VSLPEKTTCKTKVGKKGIAIVEGCKTLFKRDNKQDHVRLYLISN
jgi:hypothetical protein